MKDAARPTLELLSAGAAQGLVTATESEFHTATGASINATFGAVGAIGEKLAAGVPCDAIILTAALIDALAQNALLLPETRSPLGKVYTGIAVRRGQPPPAIADRSSLRESLLAATAIYLPDPQRATAGIHLARTLVSLGIDGAIFPRLRVYPNGATAMRALAASRAGNEIGCTQVTEINYTDGVTLVGKLPAPFELATVYAAAVIRGAREPDLASRFCVLLAGPEAARHRLSAGFEG